MATKVGVLSTPSGTGTQVVTGLGFSPKAVIFYTVGSSAADTFENSFYNMLGWAGKTSAGVISQHSVCASDNDGVTTSANSRRMADKCISIVEWGESLKNEASFVSFDSDGFTINWTTAVYSGIKIGWFALGGPEIEEVKTIEWQAIGATGAQAVTGMGFQPSVIMNLMTWASTGLSFNTARAKICLGVARSSTERWAMMIDCQDNLSESATATEFFSDACLVSISGEATLQKKANFTSLDADGFTVNWGTNDGQLSRVLTLGIKIASPGAVKVGVLSKSTGGAPASQGVTGVGFVPNGLILGSGLQLAAGAANAGARWGLGMVGQGPTYFSGAVTSQDNVVTNQVTRRHSVSQAFMKVNNDTPTLNAECTLTSFDSDGFTLSWGTNDAVATEIGYLAIKAGGNEVTPSGVTGAFSIPAPIISSPRTIVLSPVAGVFAPLAPVTPITVILSAVTRSFAIPAAIAKLIPPFGLGRIYMELFDSLGRKVGAGPLFEAIQASVTERLDKLGDFSFTIPATDDRALLVEQGQVVKIFREGEGQIFEGIVEGLEWGAND